MKELQVVLSARSRRNHGLNPGTPSLALGHETAAHPAGQKTDSPRPPPPPAPQASLTLATRLGNVLNPAGQAKREKKTGRKEK